MKLKKLSSILMSLSGIGAMAFMLTHPMACSSSSRSRVVEGGTQIAVNNLGKNVNLTMGVPTEIVIARESFDLDDFGGTITELQIDLFNHLQALTLSNTTAPRSALKQPSDAQGARISGSSMTIRVAHFAESDSVCESGETYGPFDIELEDDFSASGVTPATATATQSTLDIINTGGYSVCVQVTPAISATADLDFVEVDLGNCDEAPADFSGTWTGPYSCVSEAQPSCNNSGTVTLTIMQDGADPSFATYADNLGATYEGRVCGNRFSFQGGEAMDYDESGTFVLNGDGSASKTSSYRYIGPSPVCSARCTDSLTRL